MQVTMAAPQAMRRSVASARGSFEGRPILYALAWLLLLLGLGEIIARLFITSPSAQLYDPELGFANVPNSTSFQTREGSQRIRLNELGLNNPPIGPKQEGRERTLFIGNSMTFAEQVPPERNFVHLLSQLVPGLEGVNGGRNALGPNLWPVRFDRLAPVVKPDLVVVVLGRGDTFTLRDANAEIVRDSQGRPVGILNRPSSAEQLEGRLAPLLRRSALATYLSRRASSYMRELETQPSWFGKIVLGQKQPAVRRNQGGETLPPDAAAKLADVFRVMRTRAPTVYFYLPSFRYLPDGKVEYEPRSATELPVVKRAAKLAGATLFDLTPELRQAYAESGRPLAGFQNSRLGEGHMNSWGHEATAAAMARHLQPIVEGMQEKQLGVANGRGTRRHQG